MFISPQTPRLFDAWRSMFRLSSSCVCVVLQSQSAPWPEVLLSPKTPQTPMLSEHGNWYSLDMRASRSLSIPEDESIHSEGSRSASFRTPVRKILCNQPYPGGTMILCIRVQYM